MTLTTTDNRMNSGSGYGYPRSGGTAFQYPSNRGGNDHRANPTYPVSRPRSGTDAGSKGTGSIKSSMAGSKSSLSSVSYAVAIPVRQTMDIGKLLTDIESKPILLETNEDLDLSMSLTKTPSMWSLNDPDGSFQGRPPSESSRNSRVSFVSGQSLADSAWSIVPPPESTTIVDTLTALYLPITAIFLVGLSMLFTAVSFVNPYWMAAYGPYRNDTACPMERNRDALYIGFSKICAGRNKNYNCDEDEPLVEAVSAIFKIGVGVFWLGLALVFFQIVHQIRLTLFMGSQKQTFELRKADQKAYGRHKGVQIIVLTAICLCAILSSLAFMISMAVFSTKNTGNFGVNFRPSFVTCGVAASLSMFVGWITSAQIFYHVSGTRAETTIALSPGVKFVKTFQAVAPDEDDPAYDGDGAKLETSMSMETQHNRYNRSDSVDDDFRTLPMNKTDLGMKKLRKIPERIPSVMQKLEDKDSLMKRSIGRSQSKRSAPQMPGGPVSGPASGPGQKSYDNRHQRDDPRKPTKPYAYPTQRTDTTTSRVNPTYPAMTSSKPVRQTPQSITATSNRPPATTSMSNQPSATTRRDTTVPSHFNRPRPKPSFKQARPTKYQNQHQSRPKEVAHELQPLPTRTDNTNPYNNYSQQQKPNNAAVSVVADVHASGYRSSFI